MTHIATPTRLFTMAGAAIIAVTLIQCSGSSSSTPTTPTTTGSTTVSISAISLSPTSVAPGGTSQATVTVSAAAPSAGATVGLSSSNTSVATVPGNVTVASGATTATFTVTAAGAGSSTITATLNGSQTATITVVAAAQVTLQGISLSADSVVGGNSVTGTATLSGPAPAGGAVVTLNGADPVTVPPNVTVPAGQTSATFNIATRPPGNTTTVTISGSYGGANARASLNDTAAIAASRSLTSISLNPSTVTGGATSAGTATIDGPAPSGGAVVTLSSSAPAVASVLGEHHHSRGIEQWNVHSVYVNCGGADGCDHHG